MLTSRRSFYKIFGMIILINTHKTDIEFNSEYVPKIFVEREMRSLNDLNAGLLKDVASEIAAPLLFLINLSLQTDIVPSNWKVSQLTPLYKKAIKLRLVIIGPYLFYQYFQKF